MGETRSCKKDGLLKKVLYNQCILRQPGPVAEGIRFKKVDGEPLWMLTREQIFPRKQTMAMQPGLEFIIYLIL